MATPIYRRVIVKVSGEALIGPGRLRHPSADHRPHRRRPGRGARVSAIGLGVVVGGGNILRGVKISEDGLSAADRPTRWECWRRVMNALVARDRDRARRRAGAHHVGARDAAGLRDLRAPARRCAISRTNRHRASPAAPAIRSSPPTPRRCCAPPRSDCDAVLKATDVDGVYSADPEEGPERRSATTASTTRRRSIAT